MDLKLLENEKYFLCDLAQKMQNITSVDSFKEWMNDPVFSFFPYQMAICASGRLIGNSIRIGKVLSIGYPESYIETLTNTTNFLERPVLKKWLEERKPQLIDNKNYTLCLSAFEMDEFIKYDLKNIAAYGLLDVMGWGTYFSFSRIPDNVTERHGFLLQLLIPYMHSALIKAYQSKTFDESAKCNIYGSLTKKELEILVLLAEGLTNKDIALKMSRSVLTIDTHVHTILKKLGVPNRASAAAFTYLL